MADFSRETARPRGCRLLFPTRKNYRKVVGAIDEVVKNQANEPAAQMFGVHYEGVFASEKMCGALRPEFFKTFKNGDEIDEIAATKAKTAFI